MKQIIFFYAILPTILGFINLYLAFGYIIGLFIVEFYLLITQEDEHD